MKRISKIFLTLAISAVLALGAVGFTACKDNEPVENEPVTHEHTYATQWSNDSDYHWHAATCEHTDEVKDKAAHIDENDDEKCDICKYQLPHKHKYSDKWTSDENNHWHAPTCGDTSEVKDSAPHIDENKDEKCDECDFDLHQHKYSQEWSNDENNHWHAPTCGDTSEVKDSAPHIDENKDEKCDECDFDLHQHKYSQEWANDENNHWHAPTCGDTTQVKDSAPHIDEDDNEKCDVCDRQLPHNHKYSDKWTSDENNHWHAPTCGDTTEVKDSAPHIDEDGDYKCDVCDYVLPQPSVSVEITISANSTQDIEINLQPGVYELKMTLDEGITAVSGGLTAHVNGSTLAANYNMYDGLNGTYSAVLTVLDDSTAITLTNTTSEDISGEYVLITYVPPTIKADGTEYVIPLLAYNANHLYRNVFIPVHSSVTGNCTMTGLFVGASGAYRVYKNGDLSSTFANLSSSAGFSKTVDFTGVESLYFRSSTAAMDYNIILKIEPVTE